MQAVFRHTGHHIFQMDGDHPGATGECLGRLAMGSGNFAAT